MSSPSIISSADAALLKQHNVQVTLEKEYGVFKFGERKFRVKVLNRESVMRLEKAQCEVVAQKVAVMLLKKELFTPKTKLHVNINSAGYTKLPSADYLEHENRDMKKNTTEDFNQLVKFLLNPPTTPSSSGGKDANSSSSSHKASGESSSSITSPNKPSRNIDEVESETDSLKSEDEDDTSDNDSAGSLDENVKPSHSKDDGRKDIAAGHSKVNGEHSKVVDNEEADTINDGNDADIDDDTDDDTDDDGTGFESGSFHNSRENLSAFGKPENNHSANNDIQNKIIQNGSDLDDVEDQFSEDTLVNSDNDSSSAEKDKETNKSKPQSREEQNGKPITHKDTHSHSSSDDEGDSSIQGSNKTITDANKKPTKPIKPTKPDPKKPLDTTKVDDWFKRDNEFNNHWVVVSNNESDNEFNNSDNFGSSYGDDEKINTIDSPFPSPPHTRSNSIDGTNDLHSKNKSKKVRPQPPHLDLSKIKNDLPRPTIPTPSTPTPSTPKTPTPTDDFDNSSTPSLSPLSTPNEDEENDFTFIIEESFSDSDLNELIESMDISTDVDTSANNEIVLKAKNNKSKEISDADRAEYRNMLMYTITKYILENHKRILNEMNRQQVRELCQFLKGQQRLPTLNSNAEIRITPKDIVNLVNDPRFVIWAGKNIPSLRDSVLDAMPGLKAKYKLKNSQITRFALSRLPTLPPMVNPSRIPIANPSLLLHRKLNFLDSPLLNSSRPAVKPLQDKKDNPKSNKTDSTDKAPTPDLPAAPPLKNISDEPTPLSPVEPTPLSPTDSSDEISTKDLQSNPSLEIKNKTRADPTSLPTESSNIYGSPIDFDSIGTLPRYQKPEPKSVSSSSTTNSTPLFGYNSMIGSMNSSSKKTEAHKKNNSVVNPPLESDANPQLESVVSPPLKSVVSPPLESVVSPPLESVVSPPLESVVNPQLESVVKPPLKSDVNPPLKEESLLDSFFAGLNGFISFEGGNSLFSGDEHKN